MDSEGNNVFQGGFLGLDNVGPINRHNWPKGCGLEQADGNRLDGFTAFPCCGSRCGWPSTTRSTTRWR